MVAEGEDRIVAGENEDKQATFAEKVGTFSVVSGSRQ